jgi:site-specific DNA-methyltransferase (adenine-specific)
MRYLGCKQKLTDTILDIALKHNKHIIVDAFTGTGTMAEAFANAGLTVIAGDVMATCCTLAKCKLQMGQPLSQQVLEQLNDTNLKHEGFVYKTYSSAGDRYYFSPENAQRIDGIRRAIDALEEPIKTHVLGCLIEAVSLVSNTTGTFGAWCKKVDPRAEKPLTLVDCFTPKENFDNHIVVNGTALSVLQTEDYDMVYLDPPYNNRQYGANYHVLETIVRNDNPEVHGKTGMRKWEDTKSMWCYRNKVLGELEETIKCCKCDVILLSYNSEGLMTRADIEGVLGKYGAVKTHTIEYPKYKTKKNKDNTVQEYLFELVRTDSPTVEVTDVSCVASSSRAESSTSKEHGTHPMVDKILNMDCIEGMKLMPSESIDMILCDPPFGLTECQWDRVINIPEMFAEFKRLIKPDGAIVIFCQQPFTSKIVLNGIEIYKYSLVWKKSKKGNFAQAPYRFMCEHEDIIVFSKGKTAKNGNPRMKYNPQGLQECNKVMKGKSGSTEHRSGRKTQDNYVQTKTGYPGSILEFNNENGFHPTQKPVALCEYLVKTFSNEGDVVLDSCMGSGTTAVVCVKSNRHFIGFETNPEYYKKSQERLNAMTTSQ